VTALALVGVAHAPPFRRVLARAACPIGGDLDATAAQRETARVHALSGRRGAQPTPSHLARGLELGAVQVQHARATLGFSDDECTVNAAGLVHECRGSGETVFLRADEAQQVVAFASVERAPLASAGLRARDVLKGWTDQLGAPDVEQGHFDDATLSAGVLAQARAEWRFSDFVVSLSATRMDVDEVVVTVEAQAVPPAAQHASR
jgi:hypothetical protein